MYFIKNNGFRPPPIFILANAFLIHKLFSFDTGVPLGYSTK